MPTTPARAFDITAKSGTLLLSPNGEGRADFTVTNAAATKMPCRAVVEPLGGSKPEWFSIEDRVERTLEPQTSTQFTIVARVPRTTTPGTYQLRLDIISEDDGGTRDDIQVLGQTVSFEVKPLAVALPARTWWQRNWKWVVPTACVVLTTLVIAGVVQANRRAAERERQRLAAIEVERERLAAEEREKEREKERLRLVAEAEAREKQRLADEAEAKRKADELAKAAAAAEEVKRKEREAAEAKRKAQEAAEAERRRLAAEAESKRQSERITKVRLTVKTGDTAGAGTDANVFLRLVSAGSQAEARMPNLGGNDTERGDTTAYPWLDLGGDVRVATLRDIVLRHDDSGPGSGWYVGHVKVEVSTNQGRELVIVDYDCNCWLATDEGDRRIERSLQRR